MANTRILEQEFESFEPRTIHEAVEILHRYEPNAKVMAGGTDLLVQMKQGITSPDYLVDLKKIPELNHITRDGSLRIGAATPLRDVLDYCSRDRRYTALFEAIKSLGRVQIRNVGTIGGNLCNGSPAADSAPPLLVFDSLVKLCSVKGERILRLEEFFKNVNVTVLNPNEILTEIQIPTVPKRFGSAFSKITRGAADISKVSVAVAVERKNDICSSCRIALGSVAPIPMLITGAQGLVIGKKIEFRLLKAVGEKAAEEIEPLTDLRSTADYRRRVAAVLVKDLLWKAWKRTE